MHNISTHQKNSRIGILLFSWLLIGFNSFSQTSYTWTGSTSTDWNTSTNWTPNTVPTSVDYVTIRNTTNSPSLSGSVTVAQFSINSSTLTLNGNTLATTNSATFSGSIITSGSILASGSSIDLGTTQFNASITAACEDVFFYGSTFGQSVNLTKTGLSDDYSSGNNSFNAPVTFTLTGYGSMYLEFNNDDYFNSNIIVNCTSYNLDFLSFGENGGGHVYLASGQTITVGSQGFIGYLSLGYFNQLGNTAQNITVTGNGTLSVGNNSVFNGSLTLTAPTLLCGIIILNGPVNFTSPYLDIYDGTYNASAIFNTTGNDSTTFINTGDSAVHSYGGNVFNGDLTINQLGNGLWSEAGAASDTYLGNIVVNTPNNGHVEFGNGENYWGSNNLPSYFTGVTNQSISGTTNNFIIDNLQLIKPSGNLLVNTSVEVSNTLNLQSGNIIMSSPNVLKLDKNIQVSGGSSTSFIDGPVQYTGNKAFTFPCGNGSDYNPISISAPANVTDAFTAQYFHSPQTLGNNIDPTISGLSTCEYWTLNRTGGTDNVSATIGWNASSCDVTSDITKMNVAGWNGTIWKNLGGVGSTGDTSLGTITSASTLTSYGALTLANRAACAFTILPSASSSCEGTSVTLTASGGVTYSWSTGATGATTSVSPSTTTTYTVTGTTSGGCSNTATVTITLPPVMANASATTVCANTFVTLTGSGANTYSWSAGKTNGTPFKIKATSTYTVTGTETGGCKATSTVTITVNQLPIITVTPHDTAICDGTPVTLTAIGAVSYSWTGGITNGVAFTPTVTSNYTVTGTDANGCQNTATDRVSFHNLPQAKVHASATTVNAGQSVTLRANGAQNVVWTGGVINGVAFVPTATNTYTATVTDAFGCSSTISETVRVRGTGNSAITTVTEPNGNTCTTGVCNTCTCTVTICQGQSLSFTANTAALPDLYFVCWYSCGPQTASSCPTAINPGSPPINTIGVTWNQNNLGNPQCDAGTSDQSYQSEATFTAQGTYTVNFTDDTQNGSNIDPHAAQDVIVNVVAPPTITTSAINACPGACNGSITANISGTSPDTYTYSWSDPNGQTTQTASNLCPGTYTVTVTNSSGCSGTATGTIRIIPAPAVPIITGPNNNCSLSADHSETYSVTNVSGTFEWNVTSGTFTQNPPNTILVTWTGSNTIPFGNVSVNVYSNGCSSSASMDIFRCCDVGNGIEINNTKASALIPPIKILGSSQAGSVINGLFDIDINFTIQDAGELLMGPNAKIIVRTGKKLTITTTNTNPLTQTILLAGCNYMWDGIYVEPGASLIITSLPGNPTTSQTRIQDAQNAVVLMNGTGVSKYTINNTVFDKDYIDIIANPYAQGIPTTNIISANTFQCSGLLLPPYSTGITLMAIQINSVGNYSINPRIPSAGITIGDNSSTSLGPNIFNGVTTNMENGISATSSILTVQNCQFENIFGAAIYFVGVSRRDRILNVLDNPTTGVTNTFQNCGYGIQATFSNLSVRNTKMNNIKFVGIMTTDGVSSNSINSIGIQGNHISMALSIGTYRRPPTGILDQSVMTNYMQVVHSKNYITNAVYGIWFTNVIGYGGSTGTRIDDNYIVWDGSSPLSNNLTSYYPYYSGIYLQNCQSMFIDNNHVTKSGPSPNSDIVGNAIRGIDIENSNLCTIENNRLAFCGSGIFMQDADPNSQLACNNIIDSYYGFNFVGGFNSSGVPLAGADIGPQLSINNQPVPTANRWTGTTSSYNLVGNIKPAIHWYWNGAAGSSLDPGNNGKIALGSLLGINNTFETTSNPDNCSSPTYPQNRLKLNPQSVQRDSNFGYIVRNTVNFGTNDAQIKQFDKNKLYKYFKDNPSILQTGDSSDIIYQHFQDSLSNSNIGAFEQVQTYIDSADVTDALRLNSSISPTCVQEQNKKTVNDIYLKTWMQNKPYQYTSAQQQALSNIAGQDPILAGDASYSACVMLGTFCPTFSNNGSGQRLAQTSSSANIKTPGKIYPNPNNGNMMFKYDLAEGSTGTLEIYSINGKIINTYKLQIGNEIILNITEESIENGIYFYRQIVNGEALSQGKLVIIK